MFGARHNFDWSSVAYLFEKGEIPEEIAAITDPVEYNYLMVRLRKEFNDKHKSNYLKYMALNLPYHSRRDEVGGVISEKDWTNFVTRLDGILARVKNKRARIIKRRKKKGKKKLPRKTLFTPVPQINMSKDPLWREIFIDQKEEGSSQSDSDEEEQELIQMFRDALAKKGIKVNSKRLDEGAARTTKSAKVELFKRDSGNNPTLPPILYPSLHPSEKPVTNYLEQNALERQQRKQARIETTNRQLTAGMNLQAIREHQPDALSFVNMSYQDSKYADPFANQDPHAPRRSYNHASPMTQQLVHNYTQQVRKVSRDA